MNEAMTPRVSVLGLGAMGPALAAALLRAGHPTTVWNRTAGRATPLLAAGAEGAPSATAAIEAVDLVVVCLLDYATVSEVVTPAAGSLGARHW